VRRTGAQGIAAGRGLAYLERMELTLKLLEGELAVVRLEPRTALPDWLNPAEPPLVSVTWTAEEVSVVCAASAVPAGLRCETGWRALRVTGTLDFSLTGVLAGILNPLAAAGISVFSLSTYDTDYVLVRGDRLAEALNALGAMFSIEAAEECKSDLAGTGANGPSPPMSH